jgi:hypothetical protein
VKKRFVIAIEGLSSSQTKEINGLFIDKYPWWHWIGGLWLATDDGGTLSTEKIRAMIRTVAPDASHLVLEVQHEFWSGFGPPGMFDWIRRAWEKQKSE